MQTIDIDMSFNCPVAALYDYLSCHDNLSEVFSPAKVTRIKAGEEDPNGAGSVRRLAIPGMPAFEETVTLAKTNERIEYHISRGTPLNHHLGEMRFDSIDADHSRLRYRIELGSALPGVAWLVKVVLGRNIRKGLRRFNQRF